MRRPCQLAVVAVLGLAVLGLVSGCGRGGGGPEPPPPPPTLNITTTTLPDGVTGAVPPEAYNQTVQATGGTGARTFSISAGALPAGLTGPDSNGVISGTPTGPAGTANFTVMVVDSGTPQQQSDTQALTIDINNDLLITTPSPLPNGTLGSAYSQTVVATGGSGDRTFTISSGSLPAGLTMNAAGLISGAPTAAVTNQMFTVRVADQSTPPQVDTQAFTITTTAPPLTNGTVEASISPADLSSATNPDTDFYELTAPAGATVTVLVERLAGSALDPVIRIVNASGTPFSTCDNAEDDSPPAPINADATPGSFDDQCINNDIDSGVNPDSMLTFQVPGSGTVTFFLHVFDFFGDARPDFRYQITITGASP